MVALIDLKGHLIKLATALILLAAAAVSASCGARTFHPRLLGAPRLGRPLIVGVNSDITWGIPASTARREIKLMRHAQLTWVRAAVDLSGVEPKRPGHFDWSYVRPLERTIRAARAAGLQVLIEADRTPYWASADPHKYSDAAGAYWNHYWTYKNPADYARILSDLVRLLKPMGVYAYELWSEPNYLRTWPSGVNAAAYTKLLAAAYPAIKRADPKAIVVMGGLSNLDAYSYLRQLYRAGAARFYDVANFHVYPAGAPSHCTMGSDGRPSQLSFCLLNGLHSEMLANHDHKPVIITEIGWSTCTTWQCVRPQIQAKYVRSTFGLLSDRAYSWVKAVFFYSMRDLGSFTLSPWGGSLGVVTGALTPKPAYAAITDIAKRARARSSPTTLSELVPAQSIHHVRFGRASASLGPRAGRCPRSRGPECPPPIS